MVSVMSSVAVDQSLAATHHLVDVPVQGALLQDKPVFFPFTSQEAATLLLALHPALTVHHTEVFDGNTPSTHGCS